MIGLKNSIRFGLLARLQRIIPQLAATCCLWYFFGFWAFLLALVFVLCELVPVCFLDHWNPWFRAYWRHVQCEHLFESQDAIDREVRRKLLEFYNHLNN
jgi:hypothetical protein